MNRIATPDTDITVPLMSPHLIANRDNRVVQDLKIEAREPRNARAGRQVGGIDGAALYCTGVPPAGRLSEDGGASLRRKLSPTGNGNHTPACQSGQSEQSLCPTRSVEHAAPLCGQRPDGNCSTSEQSFSIDRASSPRAVQ